MMRTKGSWSFTNDFLKQNVERLVIIGLKDGMRIRGVLRGFDRHTNLVLVKAEDVTNFEDVKGLDLVVIRGDNIVFVSPHVVEVDF